MKEKPNYYAIIPANVRYDNDLRPNAKLLYGEITALTYKTGICYASNNYFARLYQVDASAISKWIKNLQDKNYIEVEYIKENNQIIKREIKIIGIDKNQYVLPKEQGGYCQKDNRGYCQKAKENNTSNINNTSINKKEIYKEKFEDIWKLYPNKKGKTNAYKSFTKAIKDGVSLDTIKQGVINYVNYIELENVKPQYIKHGSTWFNQRCWEDDYTIKRKLTTKDLKIDISDF